MANQPPNARPFIRLPYFGRQAAQPPPPRPAPAVRPPIVRGGFAQALRPNPPQLQPPAAPQVQLRPATPSPPPSSTTPMRSPMVSSPIISSPSPTTKSPMASPTTKTTVNLPTPRESPRSLQSSLSPAMASRTPSPMASPTTKTAIVNLPTPRESPRSVESSPSPVMATRSPSPISLPPSQLQSSKGEVEHRTLTKAGQQTTVVDKQVIYSTTPKGSPVTKGLANTYKDHYGQNFNKDGEGVVTMAGENKGAVMELRRGGKFTDNVSNESELEEESDEEDDNGRGSKLRRRMPRNAYVNSNVQGVNDSILYNCTISHHDPGVHFSLSRNGGYTYSNGNGIKHHGNRKRH